jgi:HAD superfamily hydrolase (TIGR01509 family)
LFERRRGVGMIKAVVFDFDGLIFDTETFIFQSMREVFLKHNLNLTLDDWCNKCIKNPDEYDAYTFFQECLGKSISREEIGKLHEREYIKVVNGKSARPGVEEYLIRCRELGIKIGLATNNHRKWIDMHLEKLNLTSYFDYICTREDVERKKPFPDAYLKVLEEFKVKSSNSIAFEDSPDGALAAKRANMYCVVVPNEVTKGLEFSNEDIDLFIESMLDTELDKIIENIQKS